MEPRPEDEQLIERYLLGELAEESQNQVQDRLLTDPDFFKLLLLLENELIDRFTAGRHRDDEQEKFKGYFLLAPERRSRLRFAKALNRYVSQRLDQQSVARERFWHSWLRIVRVQNPVAGFSIAAAAVLVAIGAVWLFREYTGAKEQPLEIQARDSTTEQRARMPDRTRAENGNETQKPLLPGEVQQSAAMGRGAGAIAVVLMPSTESDLSGIKDVTVPKDAQHVYVRLSIEGSRYKRYRAELRSRDDKSVWSSGPLKVQTRGEKTVILSVPAELLAAGDYEVSLSGEAMGGDATDGTASGVRVRGVPGQSLRSNRRPAAIVHHRVGAYRFRVIR